MCRVTAGDRIKLDWPQRKLLLTVFVSEPTVCLPTLIPHVMCLHVLFPLGELFSNFFCCSVARHSFKI